MKLKAFPTLAEGIKNSFMEFAKRPCLDVMGEVFSYAEIGADCFSLAAQIGKNLKKSERFFGVFAYRSKNTYIGIYGTLLSGKGYVPLNPKFPSARIKQIIENSGLQSMLLSAEGVTSFEQLADKIESLTIFCALPKEIFERLTNDYPQHKFIYFDNDEEIKNNPEINVAPEDFAYLLFTSGSTGKPKGVAITHRNVCSYSYYSIRHYGILPTDRVSQMPDITFDLSIHDLFVSILSGACLCVVPETQLIAPGKFIREKEITFWTSVPSVVGFLDKFGMLKPNAFPTIRNTMFCGEALPLNSARLWQIAAPNSLVENTYGPTETTVAITNYIWNHTTSPEECLNGIVPLGKIFHTQKVKLMDENGKPVGAGEVGEIYLSGSQVADGYFNYPELTTEKFVRLAEDSETIWYKTGDLAKMNDEGVLFYKGRIDEQVKIRGYRVELQEVDRVLREFSKTESAVSIVKKSKTNDALSIVCFVQGTPDEVLKTEIFQGFRRILPEYMIPAEINFITDLPLNQNGKIDRKMLLSES